MATATQKPSAENPPLAPTFSYAQAAKGQSPSVPSLLPTNKTQSHDAEVNEKIAPSPEQQAVPERSGQTPTENIVKEMSRAQEERSGVDEMENDSKQGDNKEASKVGSESLEPAVAGQSQPASSAPSTPELGTTSMTILPKEDDAFSTANGSSDATSDKQSQTSINGSKEHEKSDGEKEQGTGVTWDEEVTVSPPTLKEAPPPQVNVWKLRSDAAKKQAPTPIPPKQPSLANGAIAANPASKDNEAISEPKKQEIKKKARQGFAEDRSVSGNYKDSNKAGETASKSNMASKAPPPPPGDAISWPTPDSVVTDGKKKSQDRPDKGDKESPQAPKPHGKEKWVAVPYVPSAIFNTPLPPARRGGRNGPRGGREGEHRGRNIGGNNAIGEKSAVAGATNGQASATGGQDRGKMSSNSTNNSNPSKPKRASSAGPATPREQRKISDAAIPERRKEGEGVPQRTNGPNFNTARRPSAPITREESQDPRSGGSPEALEPSWGNNIVQSEAHEGKDIQANVPDAKIQSESNGSDRRYDGAIKSNGYDRHYQGNGGPRERGEPRPDRGRGGYRGRGAGNHAFHNSNLINGPIFSNGYQSHYQPPSASPSKLQSNHERLPPQSQGSYQPRQYRANSRSQSIPHSNPYGRFSNGNHGAPPHLANLQTDLANEYGYIPAHQGAMTAMPFNLYNDQPSVNGMVNLQMHYYFSIENLCKDMYLRSHMDSQGFVFLDLLAKFNRIKQLTSDIDVIRQACLHSQTIEYVNIDGVDRVRARKGWEQWVLRMEERDMSARNEGPSLQTHHQHTQPYNYGHHFEDRYTGFPRSNANGNSMEPASHPSLNGAAPAFGQSQVAAEPNGFDVSMTQTPLSAAASDFSFPARPQRPRDISTPESQAAGTGVFSDAQCENLHILVSRPLNATSPVPPPFHTAASRTFSNGSIDGRSIKEELSRFAERHTRPLINGEASDSMDSPLTQRSRSPFSVASPSRGVDTNVSPPVLWIKDGQNPVDALKNIPKDLMHEPYHEFHRDALRERDQAVAGKENKNMESLYHFWCHFLVRNFNVTMYKEFHRLALEDATQRDSQVGIGNLMKFYEESILSTKPVSDDMVLRDFLGFVNAERSKTDRPIITKMKAQWRNGAFNMRNRSKLTKLLDADLMAEIDR